MTLIAAGVTAAWYERDVRDQDKLNQMVNTQPRIDASIELVRETTDVTMSTAAFSSRPGSVEARSKSHITFILFIWGFVSGAVKLFMWRMDWTLPFKVRAIPHLLWRPKTATVRVAELRLGKWWDDFTVATSCATLVVELEGSFHCVGHPHLRSGRHR